MIHTRTKIIAIISLGFFVVVATVYGIFFRTVRGQEEALAREEQRVTEIDTRRQTLFELESTIASSQEERAALARFILADEDIIELLSLVERTGREQGVLITTDALTVDPIDEVFEELHVTLRVEGSFDGIMRMLRILEALLQQSRISRLAFSKVEKAGVSWQAAIDLRVTKFKKHEN